MDWELDDTVEYLVVGLNENSDLIQTTKLANSDIWHEQVLGPSYLWNKEKFFLGKWQESGVQCLKGTTNVGDSLEDAWSIVALLRELTRQNEDLCVRVWDNDGEFLLIEGADYVPKWLTPEISTNRVWIYRGRVCIIPKSSEFGRRQPTFGEAVDWLRRAGGKVKGDNNLDLAVFGQLEPREEIFHRARVCVPRLVAAILLQYPHSLTHALEAFFSRDAKVEAQLSAMPVFKPQDNVDLVVKFTRRQYVELVSTDFSAPAVFGEISDHDDLGRSLGAKVAFAFELLVADYTLGEKPSKQDLKDSNTLSAGWAKDFREYTSELSRRGIFSGEVPGSARFQAIWDMVADQYLLSRQLADSCYVVSRAAREAKALPIPTDEELGKLDSIVDSDDWLTNRPPDVDAIESIDPDQMVERLTRFMDDTRAGLEGVDDREYSEDDDDDDDDDNGHAADDYDDDNDSLGDSALHPVDPNDPNIDLDDFLEFFMKDALKLSPEEIESYRADNFTSNDPLSTTAPADDELDDILSQGLDDSFSQAMDMNPEEILRDLKESLKSGGGLDGPAATFLRQLLVDMTPERSRREANSSNE
jgi:hypothetical protein